MRRRTFCVTMSLAVGALVVAFASPLGAATSITTPSDNPHTLTVDASGKPDALTVKASGFKANTNVYIEECSGKPSTESKWQATLDCDIQTSPAATITDAQGVATFEAADANHAFHPVSGASPQNLFACVPSGQANPKAHVPSYDDCQVRVSTNNISATDDQAFLAMTLPGGSGSGSGSSSAPPYALIAVGVGVVVIGGGAFFLSRRRAARA
jgi:hypothetical protein